MLPATTVWRPATTVYGADATGTWRVIWADVVRAATAVTATWVQPHKVTISWTLPAVNVATQWIVRRSDNTEVGRVGPTVATITDLTPLVTPNGVNGWEYPTTSAMTWTVAATDGTTESARATSNTLTVSVDPATVTPVASYPSQSTSSTANVTLSWTANATYGEPDLWWPWSDRDTFYGAALPGTQRSVVLTGIPRGYEYNFRAVPWVLYADGVKHQAGNWSSTTKTAILPNVPQPQYWRASGVSRLEYGFWGPDRGGSTDYELQTSLNGSSWTAFTTTTSGGPHYYSTTVPAYMRVRTRSPGSGSSTGAVSDWVVSGPASPVNDATGPAAPIIQSFQPEASFGRMVVRALAPADADQAYAWIYTRSWPAGGTAPGFSVSWEGPAGPSASLVWPTGVYGPNTVTDVIIRGRDVNGNIGTDVYAAWTVAVPSQNFDPIDGGTGRGPPDGASSVWRTDATGNGQQLLMGNTTAGNNCAYFFYGDGLRAYCAQPGRTITSLSIEYCRLNDQGLSTCMQPGFWVHTHATKNGGIPPPGIAGQGDTDLGPCVSRQSAIGNGQAVRYGLPIHWASWFAQGYRGAAMYRNVPTNNVNDPAACYMKFYNPGAVVQDPGDEAYLNGRIWVNSLG